MKIIHLITNDKFTYGYINFMNTYMNEYDHLFYVATYGFLGMNELKEKINNIKNVHFYSSGWWIIFSRKINRELKKADKIVVSGIFGFEHMIYFWSNSIFNKTYLHYWGGDFYQLRNEIDSINLKKRINRYKLLQCFRRAKGAIFLISGEYEKYKEITGIEKKHVFIATMPADSNSNFPFSEYRKVEEKKTTRIVIGNSATKDNFHEYCFKLLEHLKNENIEIVCPLSYGDTIYGKEIAQMGNEIFADKFYPIFEWMRLEDYYKFLATCDIGVFGNDRQQGMGNIFALLSMGKKVYLRKDTSMYENYKKNNLKCYDIELLKNIDILEFIDFQYKEKNENAADMCYKPYIIKKEWTNVFEE